MAVECVALCNPAITAKKHISSAAPALQCFKCILCKDTKTDDIYGLMTYEAAECRCIFCKDTKTDDLWFMSYEAAGVSLHRGLQDW